MLAWRVRATDGWDGCAACHGGPPSWQGSRSVSLCRRAAQGRRDNPRFDTRASGLSVNFSWRINDIKVNFEGTTAELREQYPGLASLPTADLAR